MKLRTVCGLILVSANGLAADTQLVSRNSLGRQGNGDSSECVLSSDGHVVAFTSFSTNLVSGDGNNTCDIFVRDLRTGITECASVNPGGMTGNDQSVFPCLSSDGRFVAFTSNASDLVPNDTNGGSDIFVKDRSTGVLERVSVSSNGSQADDGSYLPSMSADGRFVSFTSSAQNLVPYVWRGVPNVFVRDRTTQATVCVTYVAAHSQPQSDSYDVWSSLSPDGRFIAFETYSDYLVPGDVNGLPDVFLRDFSTDSLQALTQRSMGNHTGYLRNSVALSSTGRFLAFASPLSDFVPGDSNGVDDIFVYDRQRGHVERASIDSTGSEANAATRVASISSNGRYVAFVSYADNLVAGDHNGWADVFVRDRQLGLTERVSVGPRGEEATLFSDDPSISADGRYVVFSSPAPNLAPDDSNGYSDIFIRDRYGEPSFASTCEPGVRGARVCPCSNPPVPSGRGCDNSEFTGGAVLTASGEASLSMDSLVLSSAGEGRSAPSVLLQGTTLQTAGHIYGQGVRCVGGALKRLYSRSASNGTVTVPEYQRGDMTLSARSTAAGDVILPGETRYYFVAYRDPLVLGGCPAMSTFSCSQAGRVEWGL